MYTVNTSIVGVRTVSLNACILSLQVLRDLSMCVRTVSLNVY